MKKRFFGFTTYVVVFLCLYNNAMPAADSLQPNSPFSENPVNNVDTRGELIGTILRSKIIVSKRLVSSEVITVWDGKSDLEGLLKDADIVILGAPDSTGTKRNLGFGGSEKAPDAVIEELFKRDLSRLKGLKVVYLGNIKIPKTDRITRVKRKDGQEVTFPDVLLETYGNIKSVVSSILRINPNIRLVQIGGDHGNAYPFNAPFSDGQGRLGFINVDAHFDTRDPRDPTRPEGPNSGTPFRFLLEEGHTPPKNAAFLGIDKDNPYAARLEEWVRSVGVENIVPYQEVMRRWKEDRANFAQFIDELLEKVVLGIDTGHISFCIDVVNEDEAPGCSARNKNGLTSEVVWFIAGRAGENKKFRSLGVFEIIPDLDNPDGRTVKLGVDIIIEYFSGVKEGKENSGVTIAGFLSVIKNKAQSCKDIDEELVLAVDTDIGNLREYAGELMHELARLKVDNVRIFIGPGASLKQQLQKYLGDRKNCVISAVLKNSNCGLFDDIKDRIRITAVEDSDFQANYIPIIPIIELAIKRAMGEDVTQDYRWLPNVRGIREADGRLIIYLLPKSKPMSVDDLRERYKNEAVILSSA